MDNLRVLVIENETSVRIDIRDALRRFGPEIFEASGVDEAGVFLRRVDFDVLILSAGLPEESSREFLETLPDLMKIPYEVIVLSDQRKSEQCEFYYGLGVSHLLTKPINYQQLGYVVRNAAMVRARLRDLEDATLSEVDAANERAEILENKVKTISKELETRNELLSGLSSLGHDFRTPLQVIVGFSELLLGTHLSNEQLDWADCIQRSGNDILHLVEDFLKLESSPAAIVRRQSTVVDIVDLLHNQVQMSRPLIGSKEMTLVLDYGSETPRHVLVEEVLVRRVVQNLVSNAIKFTNAGKITLKAEGHQVGQNAHLMISVCDSGKGLDPEMQGKIFERGFKDISQVGGYGLGLWVCREIVEALGGKIGVESTPGQGSRFWFKLKVPVVEAASSVESVRTEEGPKTLPNILVADDDVMSQKLVQRLLHQMGFGVKLVENGHDALAAMLEQEFDAVIMDCDMPVMNGFEATRAIREKESNTFTGRTTPIIALTGYAEADERDFVLQAGATAHVAKPFTMGELKAILKEHIPYFNGATS